MYIFRYFYELSLPGDVSMYLTPYLTAICFPLLDFISLFLTRSALLATKITTLNHIIRILISHIIPVLPCPECIRCAWGRPGCAPPAGSSLRRPRPWPRARPGGCRWAGDSPASSSRVDDQWTPGDSLFRPLTSRHPSQPSPLWINSWKHCKISAYFRASVTDTLIGVDMVRGEELGADGGLAHSPASEHHHPVHRAPGQPAPRVPADWPMYKCTCTAVL